MKAGGAFSARVMIALALAGVFAMSALAVLSTFAPDWTSGQDGRAHALSRSAVGYAGIIQLARATGQDIIVSRSARERAPFLVMTPDSPPGQATVPLIRQRRSARILLVLPKWAAAPDPRHPGWSANFGQLDPQVQQLFIAQLAPNTAVVKRAGAQTIALQFPDGERIRSGPIQDARSLKGDGLKSVVQSEDGRMFVGCAPKPRQGPQICVLADPDFLNTQGVANLDTARVGLAILHALKDRAAPLTFDVTLNGFEGERSLLRTALKPPFLAATLCLFCAALLLGWRASLRYGPAAHEERAIALGKRALAENAAALIRNARREPKMGWPYAQMSAALAGERFAAARGEEDMGAFLDRIGAARGVHDRYSDLSAAAASARTRAEVLAAAQKLHAWTEEMQRGIV